MFASSSLEEVYHYVYYQLTSVALTMLDDVNGLSINFFSNEFIQAIVNFFTLFAWGLGLTGRSHCYNGLCRFLSDRWRRQLYRNRHEHAATFSRPAHLFEYSYIAVSNKHGYLRHGAQRGRRINGRRNRQHNRFGQRRCAKYV